MGEPTIPSGAVLGGKYRVGRPIGQGGMGSVYEATQLDLGRRVALKVLNPNLTWEPGHIERFRREAHAAASLGHPNIIQVTDFHFTPGQPPFLVMELLAGESLAQRIEREGPLTAQSAIAIATQALDALGAAHRAGIVHRDIKPDNIFLVRVPSLGEVVKLLDFGIAKLADAQGGQVTATGAMLGTPAYMPPEQARGSAVDARADLYALGASLYHALSGRLPFHSPSIPALLFAIVEQTPTSLGQLRPDLPASLIAVVERAMAKDVERRFQSAEEMRAALAGSAPVVIPSRAPPASAFAPTIDTGPPPMTPRPHVVSSQRPPTLGGVNASVAPPSAVGAVVKWVMIGLVLLTAVVGLVVLAIARILADKTDDLVALASTFVDASALVEEGGNSGDAGVAPLVTQSKPPEIAVDASPLTAPVAPQASKAAPKPTPVGRPADADAQIDPNAPLAPMGIAPHIMSGKRPNQYGADFGGCAGCDYSDVSSKRTAITPAIEACFAASQREPPLHEDSRDYLLQIENDGRVSAVFLRKGAVPVPHLDACIARIYLGLQYKMKEPAGGSGKVSYRSECYINNPYHCADGGP